MTPDSSKQSSMRSTVIAFLWACLFFSFSVPANAQRVGRGKFIFYDTKQVAGEESYEITREGDALVLKSSFALKLLEAEKPLTATLRVRKDLTPERFEIAGIKPSKS